MESFLSISGLLKFLIDAISEKCSYDVLSIIYKCRSLCNTLRKVFLLFLMLVILSQYRGAVVMINNIFANKRCIRPSSGYHRKIHSCEFGLTMILFITLFTFPILIGFPEKIARQNILIVHINKKFLSGFYLFSSCSYLYHIWLFP